jgi:hypothetical protein
VGECALCAIDRSPLEGTLLEKLRKIEALHAGTTVDGERKAARRAAERIRARLAELRGREQDIELLYRPPDPWKRRLFVALCRRYGLSPFREPGRQRGALRHVRRQADEASTAAVAGGRRAARHRYR